MKYEKPKIIKEENGHLWTEEQKKFLIENRNLPVKEQAGILGHTLDAVYKKRSLMGISNQITKKRSNLFEGPVRIGKTDDNEIVIAIKKEEIGKVNIVFQKEMN